MANIMSQVKLRNNTSRNAFDLSRRNAFTAKVGELLPVACIECIPGDKIKGRVQHFTRTVPVSTAAYTRIREYYDWFFVPTNLLWNKFNTFVTQMSNNIQHAISPLSPAHLSDKHPYFTSAQLNQVVSTLYTQNYKNMFGFQRAELTCKLLQYLGYGDYTKSLASSAASNAVNVNLNPFPLLAYQKIYQDYFRNSQWENAFAPAFNVDYLTDSPQINTSSVLTNASSFETMFDLRYSNWNKDLFMGLQPNAQYGAATIVDTGTGSGNLNISLDSPTYFNSPLYVTNDEGNLYSLGDDVIVKSQSGNSNYGFLLGASGVTGTFNLNLNPTQIGLLRQSLGLSNTSSSVDINTAFSILALRQAEALQKWKEITQSQQQDYKAQIEAHFGVSMSDAYSERCKYIDGSVSNLDISEVTNTNITLDNAADIAGKGVGVGDAFVNFSSDVHGYLICIYHATPLLDYSTNGISRQNLKTMATDYAIPEFDATGMVSVSMVELSNSSAFSAQSNTLLGYAPRYYDYKQAIDEVHGAFKGGYSAWVAPVSDEYLQSYLAALPVSAQPFNYRFLKVNPSVLNPIFSQAADESVETDQLLVNTSFEITAVRNLDRNGLPY